MWNLPLGQQNKVVAFVGQGGILSGMGNTQSDTRSVFRVIQNAHSFAMRDEGINPSEGVSRNSELSFSGVVAVRGGT